MKSTNLSVLITGGTGSLGEAFVRYQARSMAFDRCAVFSRDWHKQEALRRSLGDPSWARWFLGDVKDQDRLRRAFQGVDCVIHAAAIKDVISCEYNAFEALAVNVMGTENVIKAAIDVGVKKVIFVSSDKAVAGLNAYGKSKAMAEALAVAANSWAALSETRISVVRYGNVIGSSGSVIPVFLRQRETGVLTITDKRMSRFWLTMDEAIALILNAMNLMRGGEVFIPRLPSMRVVDLATAIAPDAKQIEIGIRPGEKLAETLIAEDEMRHTRDYGDLYVIEPEHPFWDASQSAGGKPLPEGFRYTSDVNPWFLTVEELRTRLEYAPEVPKGVQA